jgi:Tol biopolymer transport system component
MRLPVIPIIVAVSLLSAAVYLFNSVEPARTFDAPLVAEVADIEGIETEVAIAPDGNRYVIVSSGDLWLLDKSTGATRRILQTAEAESFPAWSPDGKRISFSRGVNTWVLGAEDPSPEPEIFKENATSLSFSATGRTVFVRDRALWIGDPLGSNEMEIVPADNDPDVTIRNPRFSPDSIQVAFIKSLLNLRGEVWTIDLLTSMTRPLVMDRNFENPLDVGWVMGGKHLVYLTNRAGSYALWQVDFAESVNLPLTQPLLLMPLDRVGIAVWQDRIVLPRHVFDSNIMLSDGTPIIASESVELEPAISPDGRYIAYTVATENKFEIWTAGIHGENPTFRTLGREARFCGNNYQLVYTHTDLNGNQDIWKHDIRNGNAVRMTDADELDFEPAPSPDGRSIAFASARGGPVSIWTVPTAGGKRLRINDGGYFARYSPDGRSIAYWSKGAFWTMDPHGQGAGPLTEHIDEPAPAVWTSEGLASIRGNAVRAGEKVLFDASRPMWPQFDVMADGRFVVAPIDIHETALWAVDLQYKEQ